MGRGFGNRIFLQIPDSAIAASLLRNSGKDPKALSPGTPVRFISMATGVERRGIYEGVDSLDDLLINIDSGSAPGHFARNRITGLRDTTGREISRYELYADDSTLQSARSELAPGIIPIMIGDIKSAKKMQLSPTGTFIGLGIGAAIDAGIIIALISARNSWNWGWGT